jgi:hypothetical protein
MVAHSASQAGGFSPLEPLHVAVAADGSVAAIREAARITLVELPSAIAFAEIGVDPDAAASDIAWVGTPPRLIVLSRYAASSTVHLLDPHGPHTLAEIPLDSPMRLFSTVGSYALIADARHAAVLVASETQLLPYQFPSRAMPVAAGAAAGQFLVALAATVEEWDPQNRTPRRRLRLPRTASITAVGGSERLVWLTTQQQPARIDVIPLVNRGQPKAHDLPEPIAQITGHPRSDLVVCVGADTGRLYVVDLDGRMAIRVIEPEGADRTAFAGLVVGRMIGVVAARAGYPLTVVPLDGRDLDPADLASSAVLRWKGPATRSRGLSGSEPPASDVTGAGSPPPGAADPGSSEPALSNADSAASEPIGTADRELADTGERALGDAESAASKLGGLGHRESADTGERALGDAESVASKLSGLGSRASATAGESALGDAESAASKLSGLGDRESATAGAPAPGNASFAASKLSGLGNRESAATGAPATALKDPHDPEPRAVSVASSAPAAEPQAGDPASPPGARPSLSPLAAARASAAAALGGLGSPAGLLSRDPSIVPEAARRAGRAIAAVGDQFAAWLDAPSDTRVFEPTTPARPLVRSAARSEVRRSWRDDVVAWSRAAITGAAHHAAPDAALIDAVVARFEIPRHLQPAIVLLYAAHLCGERGAAPVDVARVLDHQWDEALGRGALAQRRIASYADSRVTLAAAIRRVLDELPPLTGTLIGEPGSVLLLGPCVVVADGESLAAVAARCRASVGGAILLAHPEADRAELLFEARAHGAAAMLQISTGLDTAPTDHAIFVVSNPELADRLGIPRLP